MKDFGLWLWSILAAIGLFVILALSSVYRERTVIIAPGILDSCAEIEREPCGLKAYDCDSHKSYECMNNVTLKPEREIKSNE